MQSWRHQGLIATLTLGFALAACSRLSGGAPGTPPAATRAPTALPNTAVARTTSQARPQPPTVAAITATPGLATGAVLVRDGRRLSAIDPTTGHVRWQQTPDEGAVAAVIAGPAGSIYTGITAADGRTTTVSVVPLAAPTPIALGSVPGRARLAGLSTDGARLRLLQFPASAAGTPQPSESPAAIVDVPLPERWRGGSRGASLRDEGGGIISPDGEWWYRLQIQQAGDEVQAEVRMTAFRAGAVATTGHLALPARYSYFSLLLAPDGGTLYAVEFRGGETVSAIDPRPAGTKIPPCAATLSPAGDRLYAIGHDGNQGDGIDVLDTRTLQRVAHLLPGRDFYCLALAPGGDHLYAASAATGGVDDTASLTTIDARTGSEQRTVELHIEGPPYLLLAVGPGGE